MNMRQTFRSCIREATPGRNLSSKDRPITPASRKRPLALLLSALALLAVTINAVAATTYKFTDLGAPDGGWSFGAGINNAGQVVGTSFNSPGWGDDRRATVWNGTTATYLPTLGGTWGEAKGINDVGQVVGSSRTAAGYTHATLWNDTLAIDLSPLPGGGGGWASGINNSGQIIGTSNTAGGTRATLWNGVSPTDLGTLPGGRYSHGLAINAAGVVAGISETASGDRATLWNGANATDLGTLPGGLLSYAFAINNAGQVAGYSTSAKDDNDLYYATLWNGSTATDLGTLGYHSLAYGINNSGHVVGQSHAVPDDGWAWHAFLWNGTVLVDLNSVIDEEARRAGWRLEEATGINDNDWITGTAYNSFTGEARAYLLTPVPEPQTHALMLAGLLLLGSAARHRRERVCSN